LPGSSLLMGEAGFRYSGCAVRPLCIADNCEGGGAGKVSPEGSLKEQGAVWPDTLALTPVIDNIPFIDNIPSEDRCRKPVRMRDYLADLHRLSSIMESSGPASLVGAAFSPWSWH
jgi:hypothetical protein